MRIELDKIVHEAEDVLRAAGGPLPYPEVVRGIIQRGHSLPDVKLALSQALADGDLQMDTAGRLARRANVAA